MSSLSPRQIKLRVELITTHITCNGSDTMRSSMSVWNPKPSIHSYFDIVSKLSLNIAKISLSSWLWVSIIRQIKAIIYIYIYIYSPDEPFYYNLHVLKTSYNGYQVCKIIFFRCKWTLKGRICFPFSSKYKSLCTSRDVTKSYIHIYGCTSISKFAIWKACACIHEDLCTAV